MKFSRGHWLFLLLIVSGVVVGLFLSRKDSDIAVDTGANDSERSVATSKTRVRPTLELVVPNRPILMADSPPDAIPGERVINFSSERDYRDFLAAMEASNYQILGRIDALRAVRFRSDVDPELIADYRPELEFSYRIESPTPPREIAPAALGNLAPFHLSAREIVGDEIAGDGAGVTIAVLDSGVAKHDVFEAVDLEQIDLIGGESAAGAFDHGTSVASILGGSEGVAPAADILSIRVLDEEGSGSNFGVAEGIVAAVEAGAEIINLSLGSYRDSSLLRNAVEYAAQNGVLMVAAVGNDGFDRISFPAAYPEVIAVTAVDEGEQHALFPNQGEGLDLAAPGVGIYAALDTSGVGLFSGTSAAAPFVSGTLAALMSGPDGLDPLSAIQTLESSLNDYGAAGEDSVYGRGVVDWERIGEQDTNDVVDVALGGIHLDPGTQPGTTVPIGVTVQNRGTAWLNEAQLEVRIDNGEPLSFSIGGLGAGQITSREIFAQIPAEFTEKGVRVVARVVPEKIEDDVRLDNNVSAVELRSF